MTFWRNHQDDSKITRKGKGSRVAEIILKNRIKVQGLTFPDFKTYYEVQLSEKWQQQKDRYTEQWNRLEILEVDPYTHTRKWIFDKSAKGNWKIKGFVCFSKNGVGTIGHPYAKITTMTARTKSKPQNRIMTCNSCHI